MSPCKLKLLTEDQVKLELWTLFGLVPPVLSTENQAYDKLCAEYGRCLSSKERPACKT